MPTSKEKALKALKGMQSDMRKQQAKAKPKPKPTAKKKSWLERLKDKVEYEMALRKNQKKMKERAKQKTGRTKGIESMNIGIKSDVQKRRMRERNN